MQSRKLMFAVRSSASEELHDASGVFSSHGAYVNSCFARVLLFCLSYGWRSTLQWHLVLQTDCPLAMLPTLKSCQAHYPCKRAAAAALCGWWRPCRALLAHDLLLQPIGHKGDA